MGANEHKVKYLSDKAQIIFINAAGKFIDSCDTLFDLTTHKKASAFDVFPFLESIQPVLDAVFYENEELFFPRIEFLYKGSMWLLDFTFYKYTDDDRFGTEPVIVWLIQDLTEHYNYLLAIQQERNESIARQEAEKTRKRSLILRKEMEYLNKIQLLKMEYMAKLAGNMQQPITQITQIANQLQPFVTEQTALSYLSALNSTAENLSATYQNLVEFSKIDTNRIQFSPENFHFAEAIWLIIRSFDHAQKRRRIPIRLRLQPNVPTYFYGYPVRLSQIIYNLLKHAVSNSQANAINIEIREIKQKHGYSTLEFKIWDIGTAITEQLFQQTAGIATYIKAKAMGHGRRFWEVIVGKQLIELQNGTVSIQQDEQKGVVFVFSLALLVSEKETEFYAA